ncbi:MAG: AI-2E family transporter [Gammaproteobacteria bacterium]|nr:AI-2E family transporter [Gammaproteobacteria bacterium]
MFSLSQFYRLNRRVVIWALFFGALWMLRDFFGLVFLTFVLAFVVAPGAEFLQRRLRLPYRASLVAVYGLLVVALVSFVRFVTPQVAGEAKELIDNLGAVEERIVDAKRVLVDGYPQLGGALKEYARSALDDETTARIDRTLAEERVTLGVPASADFDAPAAPETPLGRYHAIEDHLLLGALVSKQFARVRTEVPALIKALYKATATMLLALLFSFLVLVDLARLRAQIRDLGESRLKDFYEEAAQPVVSFTNLVGRAIQAQALIACANTLLTVFGMLLLGLPSISMLALVVFVCSFVPVLGVFLSTTPMVLVALNAGGLGLSFGVIGMILVIHVIEAYFLNPLIYSQHLRLNPVLTLLILYIGYHAFGVWGLLLGVPVARYVIHDVLGVPTAGEARPAAAEGV